ncbi:hypothetical protein P691DRAFT_807022 [Macrolepiota fuliginosa MF-IS2]|uniref:Uncharacterized protein n=1 Tax=Macrolepiota fuliginosa MF-IS2 TaxID=1400762 RepID=A0A9P5X529_9AGAR|nr:hypothetical protein P691DRAFT_807022 [Macrolepiota fuliginosa MF-IS2]
MLRSLAVVSLLSLSSVASAASSCVAFDVQWNLLAFNFGGKDFNAGTQDAWTQGTPTDITTAQGRPPFDGSNVSCYLSQFTNAVYLLGADSSNPAAVYIYDATAKSWSTQSVDAGKFDPTNFGAILDHDTNVFYAYSKGELFSLDMELLKASNGSTKQWNDVQQVPWDTSSYQPTMALAQNHVHFLGVPGVPAGSAKIFVIHFSFMQPDPQSYGNFPSTHGQTASFFQDTGVQTKFAFIPDDGSATYVIDVTTNTTETLKAPSNKDSKATYFASTTALVQLSSSGSVSYLAYDQGAPDKNTAASWVSVSKLPTATTNTPTTGSGSSVAPSGTSSAQGGSSSSTSSNSGGTKNNGAEYPVIPSVARWVWSAAVLLVGAALF